MTDITRIDIKSLRKIKKFLKETTPLVEKSLSLLEEWQSEDLDNRVLVLRMIDFNDDTVSVIERNLGSNENLQQAADLIVNDEFDGLYQQIRETYKP